jgi:hypothetical protein
MEPVNRRSFLAKGSIGAAGAVAGLAAGRTLLSDGGASDAAPASAAELDRLGDQPVLLNVRDAQSGEVEVFIGEREVTLTDRSLVGHVLRAANRGRS